MRILVVDDEMVSRIKMETLMQTFGSCTSAESGKQALVRYKKAMAEGKAYELVMLDIDMPDMQGTEVLQQIRKLESNGGHRAAIIMVTAESGQDKVITCIQNGCDDYIAKPFNISIIRNKLKKIDMANAGSDNGVGSGENIKPTAEVIFKDITECLKSGELSMPSMPKVGLKFQQMVKDGAGPDEMAALLKQDVVIASKLIRLANSAMYRGYEKIQDLEHAIGRLGLAETEHMVLAIANKKFVTIENPKYREIMQSLWSHSLACAFGAEILTQSMAKDLNIDPFTAGLFHDIGAFALVHIIAELEKRGHYDEEIEQEAFDETVESFHAMFGAKLLEKWEFDNDYVRVALCHNNLNGAESLTPELLIVHFSNLLARKIGYNTFAKIENVELMETVSAKELKLDESQIAVLERNVASKMARSAEL